MITTSPPASASCRAGHRGPLGTGAPVAGLGLPCRAAGGALTWLACPPGAAAA